MTRGTTLFQIIKLGRLPFPMFGFLVYTFGFFLGSIITRDFSPKHFLIGFVIAVTANLSVSYSNDYFDQEVDSSGKPTPISGGSGVLLQHPELRELSKHIAQLLIGISILSTLIATLLLVLPLVIPIIVVTANFLGWFYAAPPLKLAYRSLSEATVVIVVGTLLPGFGYLMSRQTLDATFAIFLLPILFYSLAFIMCVEIPDLESDKLGGKKTFIVRSGRQMGSTLIIMLFGASTLYFLILTVVNPTPIVDHPTVTLLSFIPLISGLWELFNPNNSRELSTKSIQHILLALAIFLLLIDAHLVIRTIINVM